MASDENRYDIGENRQGKGSINFKVSTAPVMQAFGIISVLRALNYILLSDGITITDRDNFAVVQPCPKTGEFRV